MATILSEHEWQAHANAITNMRRKQEQDFLINYEVRGSWWAQYISWKPLQDIAGKYFAAKVRRKYNRMEKSHKIWWDLRKAGRI